MTIFRTAFAHAWAYVVAAWEFFTDPAIDLNTDFAPEFPSVRRDFCVYVLDPEGNIVFRAPFVSTYLSKEEIELLFIGEGHPFEGILVTEIAS